MNCMCVNFSFIFYSTLSRCDALQEVMDKSAKDKGVSDATNAITLKLSEEKLEESRKDMVIMNISL